MVVQVLSIEHTGAVWHGDRVHDAGREYRVRLLLDSGKVKVAFVIADDAEHAALKCGRVYWHA